MKKIAKNDKDYYKVTDVPGVTALIKKMIEADPEHAEEIKKFRKSLTESIVNALNARKKSLHENVKIDGVKVKNIKARKLYGILKEAKSFKAKYTAKLKSTFEDSELSEKLKNAINNKNKLIALINEELSYRYICNTVAKKLFEGDDSKDKDTDTEDSGSSDISDEDLAKMFGTADDTSDEKDSDSEDEKDSEDEEVELARVVIDMATKEDAEEMKQYCIDAGIPEDAIEIEEGSEDKESDEESEDNEEGSEDEESDDKNSDDSANESITYKELRRLFEDEEAEDGAEGDDAADAGAEDGSEESEDNEEDAESEEESVKFILTDTDYVDELAEVLNDVYGITKEEFEEMIGGEIVNEDDKDDDEDTDEDSADSDKKKEDDAAEDSDEEEISASDIFGNM